MFQHYMPCTVDVLLGTGDHEVTSTWTNPDGNVRQKTLVITRSNITIIGLGIGETTLLGGIGIANVQNITLKQMKKEQEDKLCRRVCMKMLNAKLSAAWEAWQEHNRLKLLLDRVGARWLKQGMVRCMNTWKCNAKESKRLRSYSHAWTI